MEPDDVTRELEAVQRDWERSLAMTDDEVRALGLKEVMPGYFQGDPRHPSIDAMDRYLMDHPGPDWKLKAKLPRRRDDGEMPGRRSRINEKIRPVWDEAQVAATPPLSPVNPRSRIESAEPEVPRKQTGLWLCQICKKVFAQFPTERAWQTNAFGVLFTVVFRSPFACPNCRVFRFAQVRELGEQGYRPFWQNVIGLWEGLPYLSSPKWVWTVWRAQQRGKSLLSRLCAILRGFR